MSKKRKQHSPEFKAKIALEALSGLTTVTQISSKYQLHSTQISQWKKEAKEGLAEVFSRGKKKPAPLTEEELTSPLYEEIGRLKVELDWLKKNCPVR